MKSRCDDEQLGIKIIKRALEEPIRQIANNAGFEGSVVAENVKSEKGAYGFNAETGEYEDLMNAGVIDPTKVVRFALQNAASVASLLHHHRGHDRRETQEGRTHAGHASGRRYGGDVLSHRERIIFEGGDRGH